MDQKQYIRLVLKVGLAVISLGGLLIHAQLHSDLGGVAHYVPFTAGVLGVTLVTGMFFFKRTIPYAYVLNGMLVIVGTVTMGHFSIANAPERVTVGSLVSGTLLPYIVILWTNFAIGKALFELNFVQTGKEPMRTGRYFRYPNMGWWWVHLVAISTVYTLGHLLWK